LFARVNIIEVNVLITPLKVVNDPLVSELLLENENVLEELEDTLFDIKVIEFCNHGFLVL
jgi:hypothetical protein